MPATLIDLFITNLSLETLMSDTITCDINDHLAIFMCARKCRPKRSNTKVRFSFQNIPYAYLREFQVQDAECGPFWHVSKNWCEQSLTGFWTYGSCVQDIIFLILNTKQCFVTGVAVWRPRRKLCLQPWPCKIADSKQIKVPHKETCKQNFE